MSILQNIPTPSFEFNAGLVDNRGALALVRQGQDITGQVAFPFVRNSVKNVPDKLGILRAVPANEPAVTFDGQGRNLGYLAESARTNLLQRTEEFDNAYWGKTGLETVSPNTQIAPDGNQTAERIIESTDNSAHRIFTNNGYAGTGSQVYTCSVFIKKIPSQPTRHIFFINQRSGDSVYAHFNMDTFTVHNVGQGGTGSGASATIEDFGGGYFRITLSGIVSTTTGTFFNQIYFETTPRTGSNAETYAGNGLSGFDIWGAQLEEGSFASTYIKTTDATVTRPADILTYTDAQDFIGQSEGVIYAEVNLRFKKNNEHLFTVQNSIGTSSPKQIGISDNEVLYRFGAGAAVVITPFVYTNDVMKFVMTYNNTTGGSVFLDGEKVANYSGAILPANLDNIDIGYRGIQADRQLNDPIRSVRLWKTADWCDDATAQLLTRI